MALKWYIVHVYSGFENKVKATLEERIVVSSHPDKFGEVVDESDIKAQVELK